MGRVVSAPPLLPRQGEQWLERAMGWDFSCGRRSHSRRRPQLKDKPFALIGINSDADLDELRPRMVEENITWRSFWNGPKGTDGPISEEWNVFGWPTIYIIDHEGVIRARNKRGEDMDEVVDQLLAEVLKQG